MLTCFARPRTPLTILTLRFETLNVFARIAINSSFAAPSTGRAATRTRNESLCIPAISLRDDPGTTRTLKRTWSPLSVYGIMNWKLQNLKAPQNRKPRNNVAEIAACSNHNKTKATIGEMSHRAPIFPIPTGGIFLRNGPSNGSVASTRKRIVRFM